MSDLTTAEFDRSNFTRCRTLGHSWFDTDSDWVPSFGVPLVLRCERCSMERRDIVSRSSGDLLGRYYWRPASYLYGRGEDRPSRSEFRIMLLEQRIREGRKQIGMDRTDNVVRSLPRRKRA